MGLRGNLMVHKVAEESSVAGRSGGEKRVGACREHSVCVRRSSQDRGPFLNICADFLLVVARYFHTVRLVFPASCNLILTAPFRIT